MKKLTEKQIKEIRASKQSIAYLAWQYGVDRAEIERVLESREAKPKSDTNRKFIYPKRR